MGHESGAIAEQLGQRLTLVDGDIGEHHPGTFGVASTGVGGTHAASSPGDDHNLAVQPIHDRPPRHWRPERHFCWAPSYCIAGFELHPLSSVAGMATYVALLRSVNVGSTNRIAMADLRAAFVAGGLDDAVTHIQTGNVLFGATEAAPLVKRRVEALIADHFGLSITAVIRTAAQLADIAASNPFVDEAETDITKLHVAFLDGTPAVAAVREFEKAPIAGDKVVVRGSEVFIRYVVGAGTTKLTGPVWKRLGVELTARNWNVTTKLAALAADFTPA